MRKVLRSDSPNLFQNNYTFHKYLTEGVEIEYRKGDRIAGDKVWLVDYENPSNNEFLVINQYTVIEGNTNKLPDVILFVNGMPLVVIELKNATDENATIQSAFNQLQTYKQAIPSLFQYNTLLIASDGWDALYGSLTAAKQFFVPWKSIDGKLIADENIPQMVVMTKGMLNKAFLLDLVIHFTIFHQNDTPSFQGADKYLTQAHDATTLPCLRKHFLNDPYQVAEARALSADCILIIMASLSDDQAAELEAAATEWGMDVLIEVHDRAELDRAQLLKSPLIGINNRNLHSFDVTLDTTRQLARLVPEDRLIVSESGLYTPDDLADLARFGARCFLIGESLMRQADVAAATRAILTKPLTAQGGI